MVPKSPVSDSGTPFYILASKSHRVVHQYKKRRDLGVAKMAEGRESPRYFYTVHRLCPGRVIHKKSEVTNHHTEGIESLHLR